jgi:hypothetical protein
MKRERGCARNYFPGQGVGARQAGGGTPTFTSPAGIVQPGTYPEIKVIDTCSVARPGMIQITPKGLMGGGRRRKSRRSSGKRRATLRGAGYQMLLGGQGMQPNQYAEVSRIPGESCRVGQMGGAPFVEVSPAGYGNKGELVTSEGGNVVPVLIQQPYNTTGAISSACVKTGGMLFRKKHGKNTKKAKKTTKSRKYQIRKSRRGRSTRK